MVHRLTPHTGLPASTASVGSEFDRGAGASRHRVPQSVALPHGLPLRRSCFDMFRSEPAVSGLDGPFTPTRRSREGIVRHHPWQASTWLSPRFTLPTRRSPGFGSCPVDSPPLKTAALVRMHCGHVGFPVPSWMIHLDSPTKHIPWLVFQNVRRNIGFPQLLLEGRPSFVTRGTLYAPSLHRQLISGPISPPF